MTIIQALALVICCLATLATLCFALAAFQAGITPWRRSFYTIAAILWTLPLHAWGPLLWRAP